MVVLQTLGLPEHPMAGGEFPATTGTGPCHPPRGDSGRQRLTYTSGAPRVDLTVGRRAACKDTGGRAL